MLLGLIFGRKYLFDKILVKRLIIMERKLVFVNKSNKVRSAIHHLSPC